MASSMTFLYSVSSALWAIVGLAVAIGFSVVAWKVRRHRPDAFGFFATVAAILLFDSIACRPLSMALPSLMRESGVDYQALAVASFMLSSFRLLLDVASSVALLIGIARLAQPRPSDTPQGLPSWPTP